MSRVSARHSASCLLWGPCGSSCAGFSHIGNWVCFDVSLFAYGTVFSFTNFGCHELAHFEPADQATAFRAAVAWARFLLSFYVVIFVAGILSGLWLLALLLMFGIFLSY